MTWIIGADMVQDSSRCARDLIDNVHQTVYYCIICTCMCFAIVYAMLTNRQVQQNLTSLIQHEDIQSVAKKDTQCVVRDETRCVDMKWT